MLDIPEEIKELFRSDNIDYQTRKKFKLTFYDDDIDALYPYETLFPDENLFPAEHDKPWLVIENDRIESESLTITESLSESEDLEFGSCESVAMEVIVADVIEDITEREFELSVEIGNYEMPLGIYTVKSFVRQADRRKRKITAYDRMRLFDTDISSWFNELSFPLTLKRLRDALCDYIGVIQEETELILDDLQITKTIEPQEMSGINILKSICQINGCFGHIDKTGRLRYIRLSQTGLYPSEDLFPEEDLYPTEIGADGSSFENVDTFKNLKYEDYMVEGITGLSIRSQEGDIGANVGSAENPYAIEGNFIAYGKSPSELLSLAETLLPQIEGRTYKPAVLECNAMPWVEVGDMVRVPTNDDVVETFVMKRVTKGCQAMMDTITATGSQRREEVFGINQQIIQLEGKSAVIIKNVEEVSVRVTNLKEQEEAHFKITSEAIDAEVTRATEEEGKLSGRITVNANNINIEVTRAKGEEEKLSGRITVESNRITAEVTRASNAEGELSGRISVNAENISLKVSKGQVSSEISVESGQVKITGGRLVVDSTNFKLNGNGDVTVTGTINATKGKIGGNNGFTIEANKMYSGSKSTLDSSANGVYVGTDGIALSNKFKVTNAGKLTATDATVTGSVTATSGSIAKYNINGNDLTSGNVGMSSATTGGAIAFWAGNSNRNSAAFRVTNQGKLTAADATITGTITASAGILAPHYDSSGKLDGGWRVESYGLTGIGDSTELKGGNVNTPSLMVERGSKTIFSAVTNHAGEGEIIARADIEFDGNYKFYRLKVDTNEWTISPYNNDVATILDYIWTGHGNGWGLEELDERVSALESGSGCRGYCDDSSCNDTGGACPIADDDNCPSYDGGCTSDCSSDCGWEGCTEYGPGYP